MVWGRQNVPIKTEHYEFQAQKSDEFQYTLKSTKSKLDEKVCNILLCFLTFKDAFYFFKGYMYPMNGTTRCCLIYKGFSLAPWLIRRPDPYCSSYCNETHHSRLTERQVLLHLWAIFCITGQEKNRFGDMKYLGTWIIPGIRGLKYNDKVIKLNFMNTLYQLMSSECCFLVMLLGNLCQHFTWENAFWRKNALVDHYLKLNLSTLSQF